MNSSEAIAMRVTNAANISVGTSLALETIVPHWPVFDPARAAPPKVSLHAYTRVYFNMLTLLRNIHNAIPREVRDSVNSQSLGETLAEEAWEVVSAVQNSSAGACKGFIYYPSYFGISLKYPMGKLRVPTTPKQKAIHALFDDAASVAAKILETNHKEHFKRFKVDLEPGSFGSTLLMTHYSIDLLSEHRFGKCELLESHTGVVKKKNMWYTKLFGGKNYPNMPFNSLTLQVLGDDHQFHPWESKVKNALVEMSKQHRWSWATTKSKMALDIRGHKDALFAGRLIALL